MPRDNKVDVKLWNAEYFYAESIRLFNSQRRELGLPMITTTMARNLHQIYLDKFNESIASRFDSMFGKDAPTDAARKMNNVMSRMTFAMAEAFNTAMLSVNGGEVFYFPFKDAENEHASAVLDVDTGSLTLSRDESRRLIVNINQSFRHETGWKLENTYAYEHGTKVPVDEDKYIPISPFDSRFSTREVVLDGGTRIYWAKQSELVEDGFTADGEKATVVLEPTEKDSVRLYLQDVSPIERLDAIKANSGEYESKFTSARKILYSREDKTGLSRLRPYMSDADYRNVREWVVNSNVAMSPEALDKSIAILNWLTDNGYEYSIKRDTKRGQLKATIGNMGVDIRIMDTPQNESYIGRYYRDGFQAYYNVSVDFQTKKPSYVVSTEDTIRLIQYMLGNKVPMTEYNAGSLREQRQSYGRFMNDQLGLHRRGDIVGTTPGGPAYVGERSRVFISRDRTTKAEVTAEQTFLKEYKPEKDDVYPGAQIMFDIIPNGFAGVTMRNGVENLDKAYLQRIYKSVTIKSDKHSSHEYFETEEGAKSFLTDAIASARKNYAEKINLDYLVQEALDHADDPDYIPPLSPDPAISPIQGHYWEVLTGKALLSRVGVSAAETDEARHTDEDAEELGLGDVFESIFGDESGVRYPGDEEQQVRMHLEDSMNLMFGSLERSEEDGLRFNPTNVSRFMDSSYSTFRNSDNIIAALSFLHIQGDELRGEDFQTDMVKDKLLEFDDEHAHQMDGEGASEFMKTLAQTIRDTITTSGCIVRPEDIRIDENGVVCYKAQRLVAQNNRATGNPRWEEVTGYIGQIFEPDKETGVVETKYAGSKNKIFTPGYSLYVLPQQEGEQKPLQERIRAKGYIHVLQQNIRDEIRTNLLDPHAVVGTTTNVNNSYRGLLRTAYKLVGEPQPGESLLQAYLRENEGHVPEYVTRAKFASNALMMRFPTDFKENSGLNAAYAHEMADLGRDVDDAANDNVRDAWRLSGGTNIALLGEWGDGYFDKTATGSAKNQGVIRYGVEGMTVDPVTGELHPAMKDGKIDKEARTQIMKLDAMKYSEHVPFDRQQMVQSNLQDAVNVDEHVGVAFLTAAGRTFDDGCVVSKHYAETHGPVDEHGNRRPLRVGDKICDFAGNKSVISYVVDPDVSEEDYKKMSVLDRSLVDFIRENEKIDVIMSPYAPMSRFNAASVRFALNDNFQIKLPDGRITYGGYMPLMVTDKTVDEKTKQYDEDAVTAGKGRAASGQLNWVIGSLEAYELLDSLYGDNDSAIATYREYLIAMGCDLSPAGQFQMGYHPYVTENGVEERHVFELPDAEKLATMTKKEIGESFKFDIDSRGGFLEIPIPLELPSGVKCAELSPEQSKYTASGRQMYALPILSSYLRSGQEFADGTSMTHDYTNHYARIYSASIAYLQEQNREFKYNPKQSGTEDEQRSKFEKQQASRLSDYAETIRVEYSLITSDIEARIFEGKHNYLRDHVMSKRLAHSATAVWSPNPNCDVDEVYMSSSMAKTLAKEVDEETLVWRDPCLHWSNAVGLRVNIDDSLTGIQVNPLIEARMDGDNDGDAAGLHGPQSTAGNECMHDKLSLHNTLLDFTHKNPDTGNYALFINTKMDVQTNMCLEERRRAEAAAAGHPIEGPSLRERFAMLEQRANDIYFGRGEYAGLDKKGKDECNIALCREVSQWSRDVFEYCPIGAQVLSMENLREFVASLEQMARDRSKGKLDNIDSVLKYYGAICERREDGTYNLDTLQDVGVSLATRQDMIDTETATAIKSSGTPLAGQVSLNFAEVARNLCLKDGLDLTYNATQGVLQAKHDPVLAWQQYKMVQGALKFQWQGHKLDRHEKPLYKLDADGNDWIGPDGNKVPLLDADGKQKTVTYWVEHRDKKGHTVQMTTKEWVDQFMEIHEHRNGMNLAGDVNREQVEAVAKALTGPDGKVYNLESNEVRKQISTVLDRLAYTPSFSSKKGMSVLDACKDGLYLFGPDPHSGNHDFEKDVTFHLAPKVYQNEIRKRHEAAMKAEAEMTASFENAETREARVREAVDAVKAEKIVAKSDTSAVVHPKKEYMGRRAQEDSRGGVSMVTARTSEEKREEIRARLVEKASEDRARKAAKAAEGTVLVGNLEPSKSSIEDVAKAAEKSSTKEVLADSPAD